MNVIQSNAQNHVGASSLKQTQEMLGRSINRLSSGTKLAAPADDSVGLALAENLSVQDRQISAASAAVQNSVSVVQTATSHLAHMAGALTRMSELSAKANVATTTTAELASYQKEFTQLQQQLRDTIGGTVAEIGGHAGVGSPKGAYAGRALFGPGSDTSAEPPTSIPSADLRAGGTRELIAQDAKGNFIEQLGSPKVGNTLAAAKQAVEGHLSAMGAAQTQLELAASALQIEQANLASALPGIPNSAGASESTRLARANMEAQPDTALQTQANLSPDSVYRLLQAD